MTRWNQSFGRKAEDAAAIRLTEIGYRVIDRNVRTPAGELDLVAKHGEFVVFVEVKARRSRTHGLPEEAITSAKRARLLAAAQYYLQQRNLMESPWRIDVAAIESGPDGSIQRFNVIENAVTG